MVTYTNVWIVFECLPIDGRTIATGKLPASSNSICSVSAFVNVYVFGRLPIKDGVSCTKVCATRDHENQFYL